MALDSHERIEAVWRERATRLARRTVLAETQQSALPVIVLGIGTERYAIDLADVAEVLPPVRPTPVPGATAIFSGVINVHGEIRPVIDLRRLLSIETMETMEADYLPRVILLRHRGREIGIQVDRVEQIQWIPRGDMHPAGSSPHITGSTATLLMLLSTESLFSQLDIRMKPGVIT
jgi:chemotaxis signal transduction protein